MLFGELRREEACALYWNDVAFADDTYIVNVDKTLTEVGGRKVDGPTKTASSKRTVYLGGWPASRMRELAGAGLLGETVSNIL